MTDITANTYNAIRLRKSLKELIKIYLKHGSISMKAASKRTGYSPLWIGKLRDKLKQEGLITYVAPYSRSNKPIQLEVTPKGLAFLKSK